jgi:hypothetical protein
MKNKKFKGRWYNWLKKAGETLILLGPTEAALRLAYSGNYKGNLYEGLGMLFAGLIAWDLGKYYNEIDSGDYYSPLRNLGRFFRDSLTLITPFYISDPNLDNVYKPFIPAALGIGVGSFLEYVAAPIHEHIKEKIKSVKK